jgi:hypothetical protein
MPFDVELKANSLDTIPTMVAGIFFMVQFYLFTIYFNFVGIPQLVWIGWLLLLPGFLLISLAKLAITKCGESDEEAWISIQISSSRFDRVFRHPFLLGWLLIVIALAMITQYWLCIFCMGIQVPLILFTIYIRNDS